MSLTLKSKLSAWAREMTKVAEWQRKANLAGKKHYFFKNRKRDQHRIGATLYSFKRAARSPAVM
jgi:hypothetical protein